MNTSPKVTAEHLRRLAYLYVSQSTLRQVRDEMISTRFFAGACLRAGSVDDTLRTWLLCPRCFQI